MRLEWTHSCAGSNSDCSISKVERQSALRQWPPKKTDRQIQEPMVSMLFFHLTDKKKKTKCHLHDDMCCANDLKNAVRYTSYSLFRIQCWKLCEKYTIRSSKSEVKHKCGQSRAQRTSECQRYKPPLDLENCTLLNFAPQTVNGF